MSQIQDLTGEQLEDGLTATTNSGFGLGKLFSKLFKKNSEILVKNIYFLLKNQKFQSKHQIFVKELNFRQN